MGTPLKGVVMGWLELGDMPYQMDMVHTIGKPKDEGCWSCSSDDFKRTEVFVSELPRRTRRPDKFCAQEDLSPIVSSGTGVCTASAEDCVGSCVIARFLRRHAWTSERLVADWCAA